MGQGVLYKFQVENPKYDNFIKLLLRSYGGVFDDYVTISEKTLAQREGVNEAVVQNQLIQLHKLGVIDYQPRKDQPQLSFVGNRADASRLNLSKALLQKRKQVANDKLDGMLTYANNTVECRSRKLVTYFNELGATDCGVCDVCLERKKLAMSEPEFEQLVEAIHGQIQSKPLFIEQLVSLLPGYPNEKVVETVRYLLDNDKLRYNQSHQLEWNHGQPD